jgi:hypothetical protein
MEREFVNTFARKHGLIVMLGTRASGKSTLMVNLVWNVLRLGMFQKYYLALPSFRGDKTVQELSRYPVNIMEGFAESVILPEIQASPNTSKLLIIDDATSLFSHHQSTGGRDLISSIVRLRHFRTTIVIILHSLSGTLPPAIRENVDIYLVTNLNNTMLLKQIWSEHYSLRMTLDAFLAIFKDKPRFDVVALNPDNSTADPKAHNWGLLSR